MDLTIQITDKLILSDPFMIASSHWTEKESIFRRLAPFQPSAVTLKTTSINIGGDGSDPDGKKRDKRPLTDSFGKHFAVYTDGPPKVELWDIATTYEKTQQAKKILKDSILGLSILQGENYNYIRKSLNISDYGYVELNLKYSLREIPYESLSVSLNRLYEDICKFLSVFGELPILIKLPREIAPLLDTQDFQIILKTIKEANGAIIIANSLKTRIPPSRSGLSYPSELADGVIVGEHLFLETYHLIRSLSLSGKTELTPPIIASGGISDIQGFLDLIAAGAKCVQLCTLLDTHGPQIIDLFREQLRILSQPYGSFQTLASKMQSDSSSWSSTVKKSQSFIMDNSRIINKVFHDNVQLVLEAFKETLLKECKGIEAITTDSEDEGRVTEGLRFAGARGNISSFLFVRRCVHKFNLELIELKFASQLASQSLQWDLAIVPKHIVDKSKKKIIEIGPVARSIFELIGLGPMRLDEVEYIYYFGGSTSSRHAIGELLSKHKPHHLEDITQGGYRLLPITLQFWKEKHAILAKPPLSRIFGFFCQSDINEKWECVWETEEPLLLVISSLFNDKGNDSLKTARAILHFIEKEREKIIRNPDPSISHLKQWGFINYCRVWLGLTDELFL
jgi:dihydroorotate dehydrogenase